MNCTSNEGIECRWGKINVRIPEVLMCNGCEECDAGLDEAGCDTEISHGNIHDTRATYTCNIHVNVRVHV